IGKQSDCLYCLSRSRVGPMASRNRIDLCLPCCGDDGFEEVICHLSSSQSPDFALTQTSLRVHDELLREFDDGSVAAAEHRAHPASCAVSRDSIDEELNLVRKKGIETHEFFLREFALASWRI